MKFVSKFLIKIGFQRGVKADEGDYDNKERTLLGLWQVHVK